MTEETRLICYKKMWAGLIAVVLIMCAIFGSLSLKEDSLGVPVEADVQIKLITNGIEGKEITDQKSAYALLEQVKDQFGYKNAYEELTLDKIVPTAFGRVFRFSQIWSGIEVFGKGINISADNNGRVLSASGDFLAGININPSLAISAKELPSVIYSHFSDCTINNLKPSIYSLNSQPKLSYNIEATLAEGNFRLFIDATNGELLNKISLANSITFGGSSVQTTQTDYYGQSQEVSIERVSVAKYYLADATRNIYMLDNKNLGDSSGAYLQNNNYYQSTSSVFSDSTAISGFLNIINAFDYYANADNIGVSVRGIDNSVDYIRDNADSNKEMTVRGFMHYGTNYENAFYTSLPSNIGGFAIVFGDGKPNGAIYHPARAKDIVGHEYHHAVTDYVAGLIYQNASGALNEAYSDIFGALIEDEDIESDNFWLIGETATPNNEGVRSMKNPKLFGLPDHMDNKIPFSSKPSSQNDYGGVHYNNGIITHIQYKMWKALPNHFSKANIGKLWYSVLGMLNSDASFEDFRLLMLQAASQLGWSAEVLKVMNNCFATSGIGSNEVRYAVSFVANGQLLNAQLVLAGENAIAPTNPTIPSTTQYSYEFIGWDGDFNNVNSDLTINAVCSSILRSYTITWIVGSAITSQLYFYGQIPIYDGQPYIEPDELYVYVFKQFDKEIVAVVEEATYVAQFESVLRDCIITFYSDGEVVGEHSVEYGELIINAPQPQKSGYNFMGWYLDEGYLEQFDLATDTVESTIELYARWEKKSSKSICGTIYGTDIMGLVGFFCIGAFATVMLKNQKRKFLFNV